MSRSGPILVVYALTLFVSALLLFLVQPMVGKLIVPLLGGFPSVWNTCMVFFQAMLLAGYAYAHGSTAWLGERKQAAAHLVVLLVPFLVLTPLGVFTSLVPAGEDNPIPGLLLMLLASVGLPFFAVAATAPLLQRWFASTDHPAAKDPYFLYAASNVGSMLALLGYPTLVEPNLALLPQRWAWTIGYALLVLLIAFCAVLLWRSNPAKELGHEAAPEAGAAPSGRRVLHWVGLAFVPSSLMLGATTYITTDIAAVPMFWVLPLALYLLSFILVFSRLPAWVHTAMVVLLPLLVVILLFSMFSTKILYNYGSLKLSVTWQIALHLLTLFVAAMVCHGELARTRPAARHLTAFYLWMSVGGVLGGLFNALLAPVVFSSLAEYPLALAFAVLLLPGRSSAPARRWLRAAGVVLAVATIALAAESFRGYPWTIELLQSAGWDTPIELPGWLWGLLTCGLPLLLALLLVRRRLLFGLTVLGVVLVSFLPALLNEHILYRGRSFFTTLAVSIDLPQEGNAWQRLLGRMPGADEEGPERGFTSLVHGNILHGVQGRYPRLRSEPMAYFYPEGPIGNLFAARRQEHKRLDVAVLGLGAGTLAAYAEPGDHFTFYEIDPLVKAVSFDRATYFSYVHDARQRGATVDIVLGDGRLQLDRATGRHYDLIFLDAFTSDAIPVHLITREALTIYLDRLKLDGILIFNTTNTFVTLEPVLGNLADSFSEPLATLGRHDFVSLHDYPYRSSTSWVLLARRPEDFGALNADDAWQPVHSDPSVGVWRDDYAALFRVLDWQAR